MQINEQIEDDIIVLELKGNLMTDDETDELQHKIRELESNKVVLVLRNIHMISSKGISSLLVCANRLREAGGDIRLADLNDRAHHILVEVTQLGVNFQIFETSDQAVASYSIKD